MITEDYVSFETAKLLKEKGFDDFTCHSYYYKNGDIEEETRYEGDFGRPTLQMAAKWLREAHNISIEIVAIKPYSQDVLLGSEVPIGGVMYHTSIVHIDKWNEDLKEFKWKGMRCRDSYEEACEAAIRYCLENLI